MTAHRYASQVSTRQTPQSEPIPGKSQVQNSAGGYAFAVDDWTRLERFLILGNEGGTYYANERKLTLQNFQCVERCLQADAERTIRTIFDVSTSGRAPKQGPAIAALAYSAGHGLVDVRQRALHAMQLVCRTASHLFEFVSAVRQFRGWGPSLRKAVAQWYLARSPRNLAYQVTKYQQRSGYSHRDVLRLAHPKAKDPMTNRVLAYTVGKPIAFEGAFTDSESVLWAAEAAKEADKVCHITRLIHDYDLVRECIPTQWLSQPEVWEALLEKMPMTAMLRNLGKMSQVGLTKPMSNASQTVVRRLQDADRITSARIHPFSVLLALSTYSMGRGVRGNLTWPVDQSILEALEDAYYLAFGSVQPTGKRHLLGIDVSGSMTCGGVAGSHLTPRAAAAAMAMVWARTEPLTYAHGFTTQFVPLNLTARDSLEGVLNKTSHLPFGGTDCALPMIYALRNKIEADVFVVLTDNETWAGRIHPCQALEEYRQKMGIPAKLVVIGFTATEFTIADPNDGGMLDCVGFDAAAPNVVADFVKGQ